MLRLPYQVQTGFLKSNELRMNGGTPETGGRRTRPNRQAVTAMGTSYNANTADSEKEQKGHIPDGCKKKLSEHVEVSATYSAVCCYWLPQNLLHVLDVFLEDSCAGGILSIELAWSLLATRHERLEP